MISVVVFIGGFLVGWITGDTVKRLAVTLATWEDE